MKNLSCKKCTKTAICKIAVLARPKSETAKVRPKQPDFVYLFKVGDLVHGSLKFPLTLIWLPIITSKIVVSFQNQNTGTIILSTHQSPNFQKRLHVWESINVSCQIPIFCEILWQKSINLMPDVALEAPIIYKGKWVEKCRFVPHSTLKS